MMVTALTSKSLCPSSHSKASPPCCGLIAFNKITQYSQVVFEYRLSVSFVSVKTQQSTPIWRTPWWLGYPGWSRSAQGGRSSRQKRRTSWGNVAVHPWKSLGRASGETEIWGCQKTP